MFCYDGEFGIIGLVLHGWFLKLVALGYGYLVSWVVEIMVCIAWPSDT